MSQTMPTTLPDSMRVVEISAPGGPDVLKPARRPLPVPKKGEVLIKVAAAGVNRPDVFQRMGSYPPPPGASDIPGLEVAGEVVALGPDAQGVAQGVAVGAQVCALTTGGGYAEYCTAAAAHCLPFPKGYDAVRAAALPETFFTVWHNVFQRGALQPGESLLVHGGSSGIGTTAIQLGAAFGARVFATAGSAEKCAACVKLGAERAINYKDEDFVETVRGLTGGKGVDVILDMVGGDYISRDIKAMAPGGRLVFIAFLRGSVAEVNFMPLMLKRLTITGSTLRSQPESAKTAVAKPLFDAVWPLLDDGRIAPLIDTAFPLEKAADAHHLMESNRHIGKIMLEV